MRWTNTANAGTQKETEKLSAAIAEIDSAGGVTDIERLQSARPDLMLYTYQTFMSLLEPDDPGELSYDERDLIALRVASLASCFPLVERHLKRLKSRGASEEVVTAARQNIDTQVLDSRSGLILEYTDRLCLRPYTMSCSTMRQYIQDGLSERAVVTVTQLVSYMSFHVRLIFGLGMQKEEI